MTDHDVIDDALQARDDTLQHRGPRQFPHGLCDRTFGESTIEIFRLRHAFLHGEKEWCGDLIFFGLRCFCLGF